MLPCFRARYLSSNPQQCILCILSSDSRCSGLILYCYLLSGPDHQQGNQALCSGVCCSCQDGCISVHKAGKGAFLTIAKCSFLKGKTQQLALVAHSNSMLCFWLFERRTMALAGAGMSGGQIAAPPHNDPHRCFGCKETSEMSQFWKGK